MIGLGTIINSASIAVGGIIGLFAGKLFKEEQRESLNKACGVSVIFIAIVGAMEGMLKISDAQFSSGKINACGIVPCAGNDDRRTDRNRKRL